LAGIPGLVDLSAKVQKEQEGSREHKQLLARLRRREERFKIVALEKFNYSENGDLAEIVPK